MRSAVGGRPPHGLWRESRRQTGRSSASPWSESHYQDEVRGHTSQVVPGCGPESCWELYQAGQVRLLRWDDFSPGYPRFYDPCGDPNTKSSLRKETYGQGGPKDEKGNPILLKAEFSDIPHKRGIVSMARANEPDTAGSQFFIVVEPSPFLDGKYTAFGEVTKGLGIADRIVSLPKNDHDLPNERIEMTVTIGE